VLVVSKLWTALRWRTHRQQRLYGHDWSPATDTDDSVPLSERRSPSRTVDAVAARDVDMDDGRSAATAAIGDAGDVDTVDEADTSDAVGVDELGEAAAEIGVDDSLETDDAVGAAERLADREAAGDTGTGDPDDLPLVNLFVEEASKVAASGVVTDLLKQARSFGCAVTLSMQYPAQLRHVDEETYDEVLNNVSTVVTGNVPLDRDLAARLATSDMEPQAVANRLRALSRGEWFCALPAGFGEVEPRPFVLHSASLPPGHPEGPRPLSSSDQLRYDVAQLRCEARTRDHYGLTIATPAVVGTDPDAGDVGGERAMTGVDADRDTDSDGETDEDRLLRVDTVLPYTRRLPETVTYVAARHALDCTECGNRYDPSPEGMRRAICCCSSLDAVDPDDIPVTTVNLKLTREERVETGLSDRELLLLQVIHNAQQLRYEPPAYDLLHDSMIRLLEYVGASTEDVQNLIDAGYLTHDANHPHRLYSVTPQGRTVIGEAYREGVDFGHGKGDLEETSLHVLMVEVGYRYLVNSYQENPDSSVETVVKYFDLDRAPTETTGTVDDAAASDDDVAGETDVAAEEPNSDVGVDTETTPDTDTDPTQRDARRLDVAGLDAEGNVVVTLEAERVNHDVRRAAPADYDKMAACDPEDAIWVCSTQKEGYTILRALNDPLDGTPRVEKEYSSTTPTHQYRIDTPGLTAMYNVEYLRDRLQDESL
jgi:hypothetical protein